MASKMELTAEQSTDKAFQALLSSQRDILAQMDFGGSTAELQFTEGPDNLPIVSPNASAEFDNSYSGYQYHQQSQHYYQESLGESESHHSVGVGNDRFILEQISIGHGAAARGPEFLDDDAENRMRRKRETEQEFMEVVAQRKKKQRRGSITFTTSNQEPSFSDDLLPSPCDLELDDSAASLLLDDLDFPSIHSHTESSMYGSEEFTTEIEPEEKPVVKDEPVADAASAVEEDKEKVTPPTRAPRRRSQHNMWKPRARTLTDESATAMSITTTSSDSCVSLQVEDLESPVRCVSRNPSSSQSQQKTLQVSVMDGDDMDASELPPVRSRADTDDSTSSSSSPPTVKALSVALQQSIGSMKNIQDWDKKMGLKRSHSKTMRLSSKSREQLLAFFTNDQQGDSVDDPNPSTVLDDTAHEEQAVKDAEDEPAMIEA